MSEDIIDEQKEWEDLEGEDLPSEVDADETKHSAYLVYKVMDNVLITFGLYKNDTTAEQIRRKNNCKKVSLVIR